MAGVSRTVNPLHFEDLEPHRFEDLIRQLAYDFRRWSRLDASGRLGADGGVDIRGIETFADDAGDEEVPTFDEREWRIQCKRQQAITPKQMKTIVEELVPHPEAGPYGVIVAAPCDVSEKTIAAFHQERVRKGVAEGHLWTRAHLEDMLFRPENDHLLFAYFGFSLMTRRRSKISGIRHDLAVKRKVRQALGVEDDYIEKSRNVLIRDVEDEVYPSKSSIPGFDDLRFPPWHAARFNSFLAKGMLVDVCRFRGWVKPDGRWDTTTKLRDWCGDSITRFEDDEFHHRRAREERLEELYAPVPVEERSTIIMTLLLPYSSIVEVDPWGDPVAPCPHFYCDFNVSRCGPYAEMGWVTTEHGQGLEGEGRSRLFESIGIFDDLERPELPASTK